MPIVEITGPIVLPSGTPLEGGRVDIALTNIVTVGNTTYIPNEKTYLLDASGEFTETVNIVTGGSYYVELYREAESCQPFYSFNVCPPDSFSSPSSFADLFSLTEEDDLPDPLPAIDNFPAGGGSLGQVLVHDGVSDTAWDFLLSEYVVYDNTTSGLVATDVQAAIDELDAAIDGIVVGSHLRVDNPLSTTLQAVEDDTNVSSALEIATDKVRVGGDLWLGTGTVILRDLGGTSLGVFESDGTTPAGITALAASLLSTGGGAGRALTANGTGGFRYGGPQVVEHGEDEVGIRLEMTSEDSGSALEGYGPIGELLAKLRGGTFQASRLIGQIPMPFIIATDGETIPITGASPCHGVFVGTALSSTVTINLSAGVVSSDLDRLGILDGGSGTVFETRRFLVVRESASAADVVVAPQDGYGGGEVLTGDDLVAEYICVSNNWHRVIQSHADLLTEGSDITLLSSVEGDDDYLLRVTSNVLSLTPYAAPDLSGYLLIDGSVPMTGDLDLGGNAVVGVLDGPTYNRSLLLGPQEAPVPILRDENDPTSGLGLEKSNIFGAPSVFGATLQHQGAAYAYMHRLPTVGSTWLGVSAAALDQPTQIPGDDEVRLRAEAGGCQREVYAGAAQQENTSWSVALGKLETVYNSFGLAATEIVFNASVGNITLQAIGDVVLDSTNLDTGGNDIITGVGLVDGRDVSADGSKLDGVEAFADVTGAANVAAAGALMTDGSAPMASNLDMGGNAVTNGTIEGTLVASTGEVGGTKFLREDGDGTSSWQAVPAGVTDHGALTGLAVDDHVQYFLAAGTRAMTGPFLAANGSTVAPSVAFASEPGLGFYRLTTSRLGIASDGGLDIDFDLDAATENRFTFFDGVVEARSKSGAADDTVSLRAMTGGSWTGRFLSGGALELRHIGTDNVILGKTPIGWDTWTGQGCFVALTQDGADYELISDGTTSTVQITPGNRPASGNNYHKINGSNVIIGAAAGSASSLYVGIGRNVQATSVASGSVHLGYSSGGGFGYTFHAGRQVNSARANSANFGGGQTNFAWRNDALNFNTGANPLEHMIDSTVFATFDLAHIADFALAISPGSYTTAALPVAAAGEHPIAFDTTLGKHVGWDGAAWQPLY